ncbi:MAG: ZIP family metal transporter [Candidatus Harrisonbacteria bacterium CG10_big_fil_rev_8_21_14_0_10_38_8]|uniref:ZIP family metal transporter n=1 Tax=Candidatus Harrisonbacteria bacterium CG10_big_fil_rev_8_21_14_0_10_38_8 TaxID=1974582 RepID=A0A2M6WJN4_9BACT|nr:MAG: ZIP family metal transporter [Candidatus Harrisonbacteria bacterium CG10_big_fil_rev_8_21_14_0_10_38_8]
MNLIYPLLSVLIVSVISLVGVIAIAINVNILKKYLFFFVALATGALLGDSFIHLLPEAFEETDSLTVSLLTILGIIIFFILERFVHWHHHNHDSCDHEDEGSSLGKMILFSDGLHNFLDGVIIAVSYLVSIEVGIATTIAVVLHEIPQEVGDFAVLLHSGYTRKKALFYNFLSALMAFVGVFVVLIFGQSIENLITFVVPVIAGMFIYVATADLVPELQKNKKILPVIIEVLGILIGVLAMYLLLFME